MIDAILGFWLQHAPVLSVLLPSFTAMALLLLGDFGGMSGVGGGHNRARVRLASPVEPGFGGAGSGDGGRTGLAGQPRATSWFTAWANGRRRLASCWCSTA